MGKIKFLHLVKHHHGTSPPVKLVNQVTSAHPLQLLDDGTPFLGLVPEEEHALGKLLALRLGGEDGLQGVGMNPGVPCFGGYGHRGGGEVLHLLQMEVQALGDDGQFGHVLGRTARMAADEVGDELLAQVQFLVEAVERLLELLELGERGLAHDVEHRFAGMLGGHLQASAHVTGYQLTGVLTGGTVDGGVLALV